MVLTKRLVDFTSTTGPDRQTGTRRVQGLFRAGETGPVHLLLE